MPFLNEILSTANFSISNGESYFLYNLNQVGENIILLKRLFKNLNKIYYSLKANSSEILLNYLNDLDVNFDVSSEKELQQALKSISTAKRITVSGPAKTDAFIKLLTSKEIKAVHLDSIEEYELLRTHSAPMTLRWPLESGYSQKVGLPVQDLRAIVNDSKKNRKLSGIHIYIGRERASEELVKAKLTEIKEFVISNQSAFIDQPQLFWGAGLPITKHIKAGYFPEDSFFKINLECGRALVHDSGIYLTQILEVKEKSGEKIIIINGGLQHLASHFGSPRFGQQDLTITALNKLETKKIPTNIYGSLGISTDILVKQVLVSKEVARGDWLALGPAGAYGFLAGTNQFIGPNPIQEIFLLNGKVHSSSCRSLSYLESGIYEFKNS